LRGGYATRRNRTPRLGAVLFACLPVLSGAGCKKQLTALETPPGTLPVRYVPATDYTDCLLASVIMSANYVDGRPRLVPSTVRADLEADGLDRTRLGDFRNWMSTQGFRMIALKGRLVRTPPDGVLWWVQERGYPVICVLNRHGGDPEFNHAVVVIGFDLGDNEKEVRNVHLLDPASPYGVESPDRATFEREWQETDRVMILVFDEPAASAAGGPE
jgi:hypothetical protein